uniref:Uncharacterized protein n=1 Tax=Arundo donax TaxID=35708 RepID=A0A0A9GU21_ARUDO
MSSLCLGFICHSDALCPVLALHLD